MAATSDRALPDLAAQWAEETFGVAGAKPYVAPAGEIIDLPRDYIAISLGVGENPAKRIADPFEEELLRLLATRAPAGHRQRRGRRRSGARGARRGR